jgi:hypothetical protein
MKRYVIATILAFSFLFAANAKADEVDPLWIKVIAQNTAMKKWIPKNVEQTLVATKADEASKTILIKKQYDKWEKDAPVYKILSIEPPAKDDSKPPKSFDLGQMFAPMEAEVFSPKAKVKRSDGQTLNGKLAVLLEVSDSSFKMKLWVDGVSGVIHQRVLEMSAPFMMEGTLQTNYSTNADGNQVIDNTETKLSILIPFKKGKIHIKDSYSNWFARA